MPIKDLMTEWVETIGPEDSIRQAAILMAEDDIGMVPVCDGDRIVGVVTDRDLATRAVAQGLSPDSEVQEIMTAEVLWVYEDDDIDRVVALMKERAIRRVLVVNEQKQLVGLVTLGDLAQQTGQSAEVLENISQAPPTI